TVAYLCGSGVLERYPKLRVVMVECGSGWLAWALHAMDDAYREHHVFVRPKLALLPSEYFRRQGAVTFQHDPVGLAHLPFPGRRPRRLIGAPTAPPPPRCAIRPRARAPRLSPARREQARRWAFVASCSAA